MRTVTTAIAICFVASASFGQSASEISKDCLEALDSNDLATANSLADKLQQLENVPRFMHSNALSCLVSTTGEEWKYLSEVSQFVRTSEVEKMLTALSAAEEDRANLLRQRRCEVLEQLSTLENEYLSLIDEYARFSLNIEESAALSRSETISTCYAWYEEDEREALTNPVCNDVFTKYGTTLPEEDTSLLRVEIIENQITTLKEHIEALDQGKLPEEVEEERAAREQERRQRSLLSLLPIELRQNAQNMTVNEIIIMVAEYTTSLCEAE